jgi:hypothetical protein
MSWATLEHAVGIQRKDLQISPSVSLERIALKFLNAMRQFPYSLNTNLNSPYIDFRCEPHKHTRNFPCP